MTTGAGRSRLYPLQREKSLGQVLCTAPDEQEEAKAETAVSKTMAAGAYARKHPGHRSKAEQEVGGTLPILWDIRELG